MGIWRIHYYLNPFIEPGLVLGCGRALISAVSVVVIPYGIEAWLP